jgi:hypothetical protein
LFTVAFFPTPFLYSHRFSAGFFRLFNFNMQKGRKSKKSRSNVRYWMKSEKWEAKKGRKKATLIDWHVQTYSRHRNSCFIWQRLGTSSPGHIWSGKVCGDAINVLNYIFSLRETWAAWISCHLISSLAPSNKPVGCAGIYLHYGKSPTMTGKALAWI